MDIDLYVFELIIVAENVVEGFYTWRAVSKFYLDSEIAREGG